MSGVSGDKKSPLSIYIFNIALFAMCNDIFNMKLTNESSNRKVEEVLE